MKKFLPLLLTLLLTTTVLPVSVLAYQYISAEEVKQNIAANTPMTLVDIQVEDEFNQHHINGAVATYAYPVKSAGDKEKMNAALTTLKTNQDLAVVVCPRGGGGAKRAYDYLLESGISESRVFILTKGQADWPYPELLAPAN